VSAGIASITGPAGRGQRPLGWPTSTLAGGLVRRSRPPRRALVRKLRLPRASLMSLRASRRARRCAAPLRVICRRVDRLVAPPGMRSPWARSASFTPGPPGRPFAPAARRERAPRCGAFVMRRRGLEPPPGYPGPGLQPCTNLPAQCSFVHQRRFVHGGGRSGRRGRPGRIGCCQKCLTVRRRRAHPRSPLTALDRDGDDRAGGRCRYPRRCTPARSAAPQPGEAGRRDPRVCKGVAPLAEATQWSRSKRCRADPDTLVVPGRRLALSPALT